MDYFSQREHACRHAHGRHEIFGGPAAIEQYPPSLELEPIHLKIALLLDLEAQTATGTVTHTIVCNRDGAQLLELDAVAFDAVTVRDAKDGGLEHGYDGKKLWVRWSKPFTVGEKRGLEVTYRVEQPTAGLLFMKPTAAEPTKSLYAATDHETELARHWLPTIDLPNVRTTLEFHLTAKADLTILANGALQSETKNADGTKTAVWKLDQRCPSYLVCFAIGDFIRLDDGEFQGLPVAYFAGKDFRPDDLKRSFGRTKEMLGWMTAKLGVPFPFPKYYQFALPQFGGAMENISLVSWSDTFVHDERIAPERTWLVDQVNVHEMAHSYFGDLVVCRDFAHAWLKESWATYMETCWLEDKRGEDEQQYDLICNARAYFEEADEHYSRPLVTRKFASSWQMYDRHLYPGGACRLHTIRNEIGDVNFWRGVNDYLTTYREKTVETDDFRKKLEASCGRSLQQLFDQWVFTAGYPNLKVTFTYDKEKKVGSFEIVQKQVDDKKGIRPFRLKTDLGWTIAGKTETMAIELSEVRQSFQVPMASDPEMVRFDPFWKALHKLEMQPGDEKLRKQLREAKDVGGRIHAAFALAETGKRANVRELVEAWRKEPFWGVRREIAAALKKAGTDDAILGLCELVAQEKDPLVLPSVMARAGHFRDARIAEAVKARLAKKDLGPTATASAYYALGAQRNEAPIELLTKAAEQENRRYGHEAHAALQAIGMSRKDEVVGFLEGKAALGKTHFRARGGALYGLAALAPFAERKARARAHEKLIDLLRDPDRQIQHTAARAVRLGRVKEAAEGLEAFRNTLPHQEAVAVDEILAGLRRGDDDKVAELQKQQEELLAKLRKVSDRVQDLEDKATPDRV